MIEFKKDNNTLIVFPSERIDGTNALQFEKDIYQQLDYITLLIIDCENIAYISSAGLRVILSLQKTMDKVGKLVLKNVDETIMDILTITGFIDFINIEQSKPNGLKGSIEEVIRFASGAYGDICRKGDGSPLIFHAMEAAAIVSSITLESEVMAAAILHDAVEDANITIDDIKNRFGDRVAELVQSETEDKYRDMKASDSWKRRKEETILILKETNDIGVKILWLGDKLSNMRSFYRSKLQLGDAMWEVFNQKDASQHHWYYRTVANELMELKDFPAWQELDWLIKRVFETKSNGGDMKYGDL